MDEQTKPEEKVNVLQNSYLDLTADSKKKSWYQSKTIWTAILIAGLGILDAVNTNYNLFNPQYLPNYIYPLLASFGLYNSRTATKEIK